MTSIWRAHARPVPVTDLETDARADVIIVGAGITGLSTAVLLAQRGVEVIVLEARELGGVTTSRSTGKVSALQGTRLSEIRRHHSAALTRAYADAQIVARDWLRQFCEESRVPFQVRDAVTAARTAEGRDRVEAEHRAAREAGLPTILGDDSRLPFEALAEVRLADQLQVDPLQLAEALAQRAHDLGVRLVVGARVTGVSAVGGLRRVRTEQGEARAEAVILATGTPILDRGLSFVKVEASRSYGLAFPVGAERIRDMTITADDASISLRDHQAEERWLIAVGGSHMVGREPHPEKQVELLERWVRRTFDVAPPAYRWSAQDYLSHNRIPFAGRLPRGLGSVWMATGFAKWGLTAGVAAAMRISAEILGDPRPDWASRMATRLTVPADVARGLRGNAEVATWAATGWLGAVRAAGAPERPPEGTARIARRGCRPLAVSTLEGESRAVSAVCTHLGGVLGWNPVERTWDCPLHGSRFAADGRVLEGPATADLRRLR